MNASSLVINPIRNANPINLSGNSINQSFLNMVYNTNTSELTAGNQFNTITWPDTRGVYYTQPQQYRTLTGGRTCIYEFNLSANFGSPWGTDFITVLTYIPWTDTSVGVCFQFAYDNGSTSTGSTGQYKRRYETSNTTWSGWGGAVG